MRFRADDLGFRPLFVPGGRGPALAALALICLAALQGCGPPPETALLPGTPTSRVETCRDLFLDFQSANIRYFGPGGDAEEEKYIFPRMAGIAGVFIPAMLAHPPSEISYRADIHPGAELRFYIGLMPEAWDQESDGVQFEVVVRRSRLSGKTVFSRHLNPSVNTDERRWNRCTVDLSEFVGPDREIILRTGPGPAGNPNFDWAVWGEPQIHSDGRLVAKETPGLPHVFLISLDTLRIDHLDLFGYPRLTAPHLNRLLRESVLFTGASAPSHWTMPSHMSVMTSLDPDVHRVASHTGEAHLADSIPTLAELLRRDGFATAGFACCGYLKGELGFDRGFDLFSLRYQLAPEQNRIARQWIERNRDERMFVFLHYFDVHSDWLKLPYEATDGFDTLFDTGAPEESFSGCAPGENPVCASIYLTQLNSTRTALEGEALDAIRTYYDRGIRQLDHQLAAMTGWLKSLGLWEESLVVIFSDHGEEFQEHGMLLHAQLYEELLHVPLIIKFPGARYGGTRYERPVQLVDLAPTILSSAGTASPHTFQGRDLIPLLTAAETGTGHSAPLYSWASDGWSLRHDGWKLLLKKGKEEADQMMLFDLTTDPLEAVDQSDTRPDQRDRLSALAAERISMNDRLRERFGDEGEGEDSPASFSEEERRQLELLGYVE